MGTSIAINPDQTLTVTWAGRKGRGSLTQIGAEGDVKKVNALGIYELIAVHWAVKKCPFPLGTGEKVYRAVLEYISKIPEADLTKGSLGDVRKAILHESSQGFNAPHDSYLSIAYDIATGKTPVHMY